MSDVVAIDVIEGEKENEIEIVFYDYMSVRRSVKVDVSKIQELKIENKVKKEFNAFMKLLDNIRE